MYLYIKHITNQPTKYTLSRKNSYWSALLFYYAPLEIFPT